MNTTKEPKTIDKKPWPRTRDEAKDAVDAFTASLTRAGYDRDFRDRLTASCDSAKQAVSEAGNIDIPTDVVIIVYESEACQNHFAFYLPPFDETARTTRYYMDYFQCCFPSFRLFQLSKETDLPTADGRKPWNGENAARAFTTSLTRAGYDRDFRNRLTASCDSAKRAVSEEANIDIPREVVIIFHEDELNEKYHIFSLPPFNANAHTVYQYRDHFMGLYNVW